MTLTVKDYTGRSCDDSDTWIVATPAEQDAAIRNARLALNSFYSWLGSIKLMAPTEALRWPSMRKTDARRWIDEHGADG